MRLREGSAGEGNSTTEGPVWGKQRCALCAQSHWRTKGERGHGDKHGGAKLTWGNPVKERRLSPSPETLQCL